MVTEGIVRAPVTVPDGGAPLRIAVIGSGIAGNVAAHHLAKHHDITVFEADDRVGGHSHTVDVRLGGRDFAVDTGFIVFNDRTYPNFVQLLQSLGVGWRDSDMSFSVQHHGTGLEYKGSTLNTLFAQRANLLRPSFHRMIRDILRFNRDAPAVLDPGAPDRTLGELLEAGGYSREFTEHYILPMGAAIWSATSGETRRMPARFFVGFFRNHGLLSLQDRPTWRVVDGGSRRYVDRLVAGHRDRIRLNAPVTSVRRLPEGVMVKTEGQSAEHFDRVFIACHADQALAMLDDPTDVEREVLGAMRFQVNEAVLHTDASLMPRRRRAWAAWNYHVRPSSERDEARPVAVTYNMNILQGLEAPETLCVTLNRRDAIDPGRIIGAWRYDHPVITNASVRAQARQHDVNGWNDTYYCGAYWRNGFHEDGVVSALAALGHFRQHEFHAQRYLQRTG